MYTGVDYPTQFTEADLVELQELVQIPEKIKDYFEFRNGIWTKKEDIDKNPEENPIPNNIYSMKQECSDEMYKAWASLKKEFFRVIPDRNRREAYVIYAGNAYRMYYDQYEANIIYCDLKTEENHEIRYYVPDPSSYYAVMFENIYFKNGFITNYIQNRIHSMINVFSGLNANKEYQFVYGVNGDQFYDPVKDWRNIEHGRWSIYYSNSRYYYVEAAAKKDCIELLREFSTEKELFNFLSEKSKEYRKESVEVDSAEINARVNRLGNMVNKKARRRGLQWKIFENKSMYFNNGTCGLVYSVGEKSWVYMEAEVAPVGDKPHAWVTELHFKTLDEAIERICNRFDINKSNV